MNHAISFYSGRPFTITASGTSLNAPGNSQMADQVKPTLELRFEAFNVLNSAHFSNPGANVSNLRLNPDGRFKT